MIATPPPPSFGARLTGIEGLRAIAAFSILVSHVWLYTSPGGGLETLGVLDLVLPDLSLGVTLFFALSGFLLYRPFAASVVRAQPMPRVSEYLRNRALRILPAYWVILLLVAIVLDAFLVRDGNSLAIGDASLGLFVRNALFVQDYARDSLVTGIGPAWSLSVEAAYYLSLPLVAAAAALVARRARTREGRVRSALVPPALLLVVGLSGKLVAAKLVVAAHPYAGWHGDWHSVVERSFWCQADLFAFGMALAVARVEWEDGRLRLPRWWRSAAAGGALVGYLVTAKLTEGREHLSYSLFNTLMAACLALVLALVVLDGRPQTHRPLPLRLLGSRALTAGGLISYSVFLWHEPLARAAQAHGLTFGGAGGFFANILVVLAATILLSSLTYRYVEAPALRLKSKRRAAASPEAPAAQLDPT